jgi:hypothetical protein
MTVWFLASGDPNILGNGLTSLLHSQCAEQAVDVGLVVVALD